MYVQCAQAYYLPSVDLFDVSAPSTDSWGWKMVIKLQDKFIHHSGGSQRPRQLLMSPQLAVKFQIQFFCDIFREKGMRIYRSKAVWKSWTWGRAKFGC